MKLTTLLTTLLLGSGAAFGAAPELAKERSEDILLTEISSWLDTEDFLKVDASKKINYFREIYNGKLENSVTHIGEFELSDRLFSNSKEIRITVLRPLLPGYSWRGWVDLKLNLTTNELSYEIPKNYSDVANYIDALTKHSETLDAADIRKHAETDCKHKNYKKYKINGYDVQLFRSRVIGSDSRISNRIDFKIHYERPLEHKHGSKSCDVSGLKAEDLDQIFLK